MPIEHLRPGRTETTPREEKGKRSLTAVLATLAAIATVAAIALSLLGYGVALAVENTFGIPHAQVFNSSTDLLSLSTWAVVEIFNTPRWDLISPLLGQIHGSAVALALFSIICWVVMCRKEFWPHIQWSWRIAKRKRSQQRRRQLLIWMTPVAGLFGASMIYAFYCLLYVALFVVITLIATLPSIGITTGENFLERNVVSPKRCATVHSRESLIAKFEAAKRQVPKDKNAETGASCVQVLHDGKLLAQGRVAISTTGVLVLFDPASGQVQRLPTQDAIIQPVSSL